MRERIEELAGHGLNLVQRGEFTGGRYAYLDGVERYGGILELLEFDRKDEG